MSDPGSGAPLTIYYREDQRFRGPWTWVVLGICCALMGLVLLAILLRVLGVTGGEAEAMSPGLLFLSLAIAIVMSVMLLTVLATTLQTEVNSRGVFLRLKPFQRRVRQLDLTGAREVRAVPLRAMREYGGFGLRTRRDGKAYIVSGAHGVRIEFDNGFHILVSTHRPDELAAAVQRVLPALPSSTT